MSHEYKPKRSIKDIPLANERLYTEVSKLTKTKKEDVEDIINFTGNYISTLMKKGNMEGVMIPFFGKFRPKVKKIKAMRKAEMGRANGMDMIYRAIHGKIVVDFRKKTNTDETI